MKVTQKNSKIKYEIKSEIGLLAKPISLITNTIHSFAVR